MRFTKIHGCGNDYLYVDCITNDAPSDPESLARTMSDRHFGVGSDGLILVLPSSLADVRMRMFNADGSEGQMCGNGIRGLAKFAYDRGLARSNPIRVETLRGVLTIEQGLADDGKVAQSTVNMDHPLLKLTEVGVCEERVTAAGLHEYKFDDCIDPAVFVSMGSDHAVMFVDDLSKIDLHRLGPMVERHEAFPRRVNAHWAQTTGRDSVTMKTWERGSGVTLACGTGACAVVVAGVLTGRLVRNVTVQLPGGVLNVEWRERDNQVYMTGPAVEVFSGEWPAEANLTRSE